MRHRDIGREAARRPRVWLGGSVEDAAHAGRIGHLGQINSEARFLSFEPLLGSVAPIDLAGIAWAIVGGESGPRARRVEPEWAAGLRRACERSGTAFFFRQWGGAQSKPGGRLLEGGEWNGFPAKMPEFAKREELS